MINKIWNFPYRDWSTLFFGHFVAMNLNLLGIYWAGSSAQYQCGCNKKSDIVCTREKPLHIPTHYHTSIVPFKMFMQQHHHQKEFESHYHTCVAPPSPQAIGHNTGEPEIRLTQDMSGMLPFCNSPTSDHA